MSTRFIMACVREELQPSFLAGFARSGMPVECVGSGEELMQRLFTQKTDAVIAEANLIEKEMESLCRFLEMDNKRTVLIVLVDPKQSHAKTEALNQGADVCFEKPVRIEELVAQVKALYRRIDRVQETPVDFTFKDIHINLNTHEVSKNGRPLDLTYTQFKLLYLLASQREVVFSRNDILKKVWGEHAYVTDRTVDVHVKRLREKLGEGKRTSKYIQTIHGLGYRLA